MGRKPKVPRKMAQSKVQLYFLVAALVLLPLSSCPQPGTIGGGNVTGGNGGTGGTGGTGGNGGTSGPAAQWARTQASGSALAEFTSVVSDGAGSAYAVGYGYGPNTFGFGNGIIATGVTTYNYSPLLVKYNSSGQAQWAKTLVSSTYGAQFNAVVIDGSGYLYAAGILSENGQCDFGNGVTATGISTNNDNTILVKYDSSGIAQWAFTLTAGSTGGKAGFTSLAIDGSGNLYAAGYCYGTSTYSFSSTVSATGSSAGENVLLVKYDSTGTPQWAETFTSGNVSNWSAQYNGVAVDGSGGVYAAGFVYSTTTYGLGNGLYVTGVVSNANNVLLVKYRSSDGQPQWVQTLTSGSSYTQYNAVAVDSSGNVYAAGEDNGINQFGFGNGVSVTGVGGNVLLVKYNSSGQAQWAQTLTGNVGLFVARYLAVTVDSAGNVYTGGNTNSTYTYSFGNGVTATGSSSGENVLLVKYNPSGQAQWVETFASGSGGSAYARFLGLAIDGSGNILSAGYAGGTATYGYGSGVAAQGAYAGNNVLLVKY